MNFVHLYCNKILKVIVFLLGEVNSFFSSTESFMFKYFWNAASTIVLEVKFWIFFNSAFKQDSLEWNQPNSDDSQ